MHPYISLFGRQLPTYGMMTVLGILAAGIYVFFTNRGGKCGRMPNDDWLNLAAVALVGALAGAKLLYVFATLPIAIRARALFAGQPLEWLKFVAGGLVFYGGLLGGLLAAWLYCRRYKVNFGVVAAVAAPGVPLFHVFGRVGCFLAGCCWGVEVPWGIVYTHSPGAPNGVPLLPVQLVEAGFNLLLFLALALTARRLPAPQKWLVLPAYLTVYAVFRFVIEFFRGDRVRGVYLLSTSQWVSLAVLLGVGVLMYHRVKRNSVKKEAG